MPKTAPIDVLTYRLAVSQDVESVVRLVESAYRGDASRVGWTTEADLLDGQRTDAQSIEELVASSNDRLLMAEAAGTIVASCHLRREDEAAYFGMFAVVPGLQANGVGRLVLAEAERYAHSELGALEMRMTVIDCRTELIAWYERRGYARTGEHAPFPYGDERFGQPRRSDLRFETLRKRLQGIVA